MRKLLIALPLLVLASFTSTAEPDPEPLEWRQHDLSFCLERESGDWWREDARLTRYIEHSDIEPEVMPVSWPVGHTGLGGAKGPSVDDVGEAVLRSLPDEMGLIPRVTTLPGRAFLRLYAPARIHETVAKVLGRLEGYLNARVRVQVYDAPSRLFGAASVPLGYDALIRTSREVSPVSDTWRSGGQIDLPYSVPLDTGLQIAMWVVKLPDGRLMAQGNIMEVEETGRHPATTQGSDLELPTIVRGFQPFARIVADPGEFKVTAASGKNFTVRLSCGYQLPPPEIEVAFGRLSLRSLMGGLWRHSDAGSSYQSGPSIRYPDESLFDGGKAAATFTDRCRAAKLRPRGVSLTDLGPFLACTLSGEDDSDWETLQQMQDAASTPNIRSYRLRVWELSPGAEGPEAGAEALFDSSLQVRPETGAVCSQVKHTDLVQGYGIPTAVPAAFRECWIWSVEQSGWQARVEWRSGEISAGFSLRRAIGGVREFDTGLEPKGRMKLQSFRYSDFELHWLGDQDEKSLAAITPTEDGEMLYGLLEMVE